MPYNEDYKNRHIIRKKLRHNFVKILQRDEIIMSLVTEVQNYSEVSQTCQQNYI